MNKPTFRFEKKLWKRGLQYVAGIDEVGRGCFAGPVVAGCVVFGKSIKGNKDFVIPRIDDSKKLTSRQREIFSKWIKENALTWGIGEAPASLINRIGMGKATRVAFRRAVAECNSKLEVRSGKLDAEIGSGKQKFKKSHIVNPNSHIPHRTSIDYLLIDAFYIPFVRGLRRKNQLAIIDGDEKSISIAAGSIIAKVYRDRLMTRLSRKAKFKKYGWGRSKGYGTREHQEAIKKYGVTRFHRKRFVETFFNNSSFFPTQSNV